MAMALNTFDQMNSNILKLIECPACLDYMVGNIYTCETGHSICDSCRHFVADCPFCNRRITKTRNYGLEGVAEQLFYPCTYDECNVAAKIQNLKTHLSQCPYKPYLCLLDDECEWEGPKIKMKEHILEVHGHKSWMREENLDKWKDGSENCVQVIIAYDNIFYLHRKYVELDDNPLKSFLYWGVQLIGSPDEAKKYIYRMYIYNENSARHLEILEMCHRDDLTMDEMIATGNVVTVCGKTLNTFRNIYNSVWFKFKIIKLEDK